MGDSKHQELVRKVQELFGLWQRARDEYNREKESIDRARERRELVEFQHGELKKAGLETGEEEKLTKELELLSSTRERIELALIAAEFLGK